MKKEKRGFGLFGTGRRSTFILGALFALIAIICMPFLTGTVGGAIALATAGAAGLTEDQMTALLDKVKSTQAEEITKARTEFNDTIKGMVKEAELSAKLKDFTDEELTAIKQTMTDMGLKNAELKDIVKTQGTEIESLKEKGIIVQLAAKNNPVTMREKMAALLTGIFKTEDYKNFEKTNFVGGTQQYTIGEKGEIVEKSKYDEIREKAVGVTADHTGSVLPAEISANVRDIPLRKTHVRNLMTVRPTSGASIVAPEVTDYTDAFTMGATMLAENTEAQTSVFKTKENTWTVKRIARAIEISKRYFKTNGLGWVINWILSRLPDQLQFVEDFQLIFGDGAGNNISGLAKNAQSLTLSGSYIATNFASHATYNGGTQTLVSFAAAHGLRNGDNLTLANTAGGTYNGTYTNVAVVDTKTVLINKAFSADATVAANWTGSWTSYWYNSIDNAQEFDVISVAKAYLAAGEYEATGCVLHSNTAEKIGLLKDLDAAYIGVSRDAAGRMNISAMPIAVTNAIPAGHFIVGDFQRACELAEYTPLTVQLSEDTTDKKKNQITVIAEEEVIFPLYNPYWFVYGKFADAITAIEKP